jgi:hypothetical protein
MSEVLSIGRRGFLGRTVAALAAATTANVAALATTRPAAAAITELPELIDAGQRLEAALAEWRAADAARLAARAIAESTVPPVPDEIICKAAHFWAGCAEEETDVEGKRLPVVLFTDEDGKTRGRTPRRIIQADALRQQVEDGRIYCDGRTRFGKTVKRIIAMAERYEAERTAAIEKSGLPDAIVRAFLASQAIDKIAREVADMQPQTFAGTSIMARVLCAYVETEAYSGNRQWGAMILGKPLAEAVARLG